jgi:GH24 family phage-related lysozyme (muramidase)
MNDNPLPTGASFTDFNQLPAMLTLVEGDVSVVYNDGNGYPTIGVGLNITVNDNMALVLNQMSVNGQNVFAAAAQSGQSAQQVVAAFETVIATSIATHPLPADHLIHNGKTVPEMDLQATLNNKLSSYFSGTLPAINFTNFPPSAALSVLQSTLGDSPVIISGQGYSYPPIEGYSQRLRDWLTTNYSATNPYGNVFGPNYLVPVSMLPPENSGQWEALLSLFYNQKLNNHALINKGLLSALQTGNVAEAWYQIRYVSNLSGQAGVYIRRYYESQMFGLQQPGDTATQALQDFQMLTEHRATIFAQETGQIKTGGLTTTVGADPDDSSANDSAPTANGNLIQMANAESAGQGISAPLSPVQTLSQAFAGEAQILLASLAAKFPNTFPAINIASGIEVDGSSSPFDLRVTDIFVGSSSDQDVDASSGDSTTVGGRVEGDANHLLIGTDSGQSLIGGFGNDILISEAGNETLASGFGSDTIIAAGGADAINLRGTFATVDFEFGSETGLKESLIYPT